MHAKSRNLCKLEVAIRIYCGFIQIGKVKVLDSVFLTWMHDRVSADSSLLIGTGTYGALQIAQASVPSCKWKKYVLFAYSTDKLISHRGSKCCRRRTAPRNRLRSRFSTNQLGQSGKRERRSCCHCSCEAGDNCSQYEAARTHLKLVAKAECTVSCSVGKLERDFTRVELFLRCLDVPHAEI